MLSRPITWMTQRVAVAAKAAVGELAMWAEWASFIMLRLNRVGCGLGTGVGRGVGVGRLGPICLRWSLAGKNCHPRVDCLVRYGRTKWVSVEGSSNLQVSGAEELFFFFTVGTCTVHTAAHAGVGGILCNQRMRLISKLRWLLA